MKMKNTGLIALLLGLLIGFSIAAIVHAQTVPPITIQSTVAHTACVVPPAGTSAYCFASDGLYESINGAAYAQVTGATGVISLSVNGGTPQTGAVAITVPTTASTTGTFTTTIK